MMSAIEQTPLSLPKPMTERRDATRLRIANHILVLIGRGEGALLDLSTRGARVRHAVQARRSTNVRLSFDWENDRFVAMAEVLSSHVVALGHGDVPTLYESRLRFRLISENDEQILDRVIAAIQFGSERRWIDNLEGNSQPDRRATTTVTTGSYLRCRLIGRRWERKWTHDRTQPHDGFLLPESIDAKEVDKLCRSYEEQDDNGRALIRMIAAASIP